MKRADARNRVLVSAAHPAGRGLTPFVRRTALRHLRDLALQNSELSILLVGDAEIRSLNRSWRGKDKATDVLSFSAVPAGVPGRRILGDLVVSLDTAGRLARALGFSLEQEVARYLAHGLLHLLGHDHHAAGPRRRMARLESRLLGRPGLIPP